jgi:hypothetical protein
MTDKRKALFNISLDTIRQLNELALITQKSKSELVREAVKLLWDLVSSTSNMDAALKQILEDRP